MKKIFAVLLAAALMFSVCAFSETMMVHITATCYDTNSVGKYWKGNYVIGDYTACDGDVIDLTEGKYDFHTDIIDYDRSPDTGAADTTYNVTANRLEKGFTVEQYLTVEENKGVNKGNWCEWYITWEFIPCTTGTNWAVIH